MDEALGRYVVQRQQLIHLFLGVEARHQHEFLLLGRGVDANAPQRIKVAFNGMPMGCQRCGVGMRETFLPKPRVTSFIDALCALGDGDLRPDQACQPRTTRVVGQMHDEVIAPRQHRPQQFPLGSAL